jgi:glycosyltransferase involved in cell wall biosynthesis
MTAQTPLLSICIATYRRAAWIGETLQSILSQIQPGIEIVVVDGASPDDTRDVVSALARQDVLRYYREQSNSGVDRDYDKAVGYARGEYCWLMTDDDVLLPGAIVSILEYCAEAPSVIVLNSIVKDISLVRTLSNGLLSQVADKRFPPERSAAFFLATAKYASFIGSLVVRRDLWQSRERNVYWGSAFAHIGVIFQAPLERDAIVVGEPHIAIRYGNSMWSPRALEIWFLNWPRLIMGLDWLPESDRRTVSEMQRARFARKLLMYRAIGGFDRSHVRLPPISTLPPAHRFIATALAMFPRWAATAVSALYCFTGARGSKMTAYDLAHRDDPAWLSRWVAKRLGVL